MEKEERLANAVQIMKPLWPFMVSGVIVIWGTGKLQTAALKSESKASALWKPY